MPSKEDKEWGLTRKQKDDLERMLGDEMREIRLGADFTLKQMAAYLERSLPYVNQMERGKRPIPLELKEDIEALRRIEGVPDEDEVQRVREEVAAPRGPYRRSQS